MYGFRFTYQERTFCNVRAIYRVIFRIFYLTCYVDVEGVALPLTDNKSLAFCPSLFLGSTAAAVPTMARFASTSLGLNASPVVQRVTISYTAGLVMAPQSLS